MVEELLPGPLFANRVDAGRRLVPKLRQEIARDAVLVGLARGGVVVAAAAARALDLPLVAVAVRKIGHPQHLEYALGAATPDGHAYVRGPNGLTHEELRAAVDDAARRATELDRRLHGGAAGRAIRGRDCILVDDGLATGATMVAALRWARRRGARRAVAAVPVAARQGVELVRSDADAVVCLFRPDPFISVGVWYEEFDAVGDAEVARLLGASSARVLPAAVAPQSPRRSRGPAPV